MTIQKSASILPRPWRNQRSVHRLELEARLIDIGSEGRFGRLQPVLVIAFWEVWLVVRSARFVPQARALRDHPGQLQHVVKLTRKCNGGIRPLRAVAEIDVP